MIRKQLLAKILGKHEIDNLKSYGLSTDGSNIILQYDDTDDYINIHELAYKVKEWMFEYGYEVVSYRMQDMEGYEEYRCLFAHMSLYLNKSKRTGFYASTEPEAIFKAGHWLLEHK